jgi:2-C-methyl-D-erythritol 2,4-cyclodiphosphate synthase
LAGRSDADVLVHAIIDAVIGACALGDIGQLFSDTDDRFKDADSIELLKIASELAKTNGFAVSFIDSTLIAQTPKFAQYIPEMRLRVAAAMGLDASRLSIKAKTTEHLGFIGRKEGIAAIAIATVVCDDNRKKSTGGKVKDEERKEAVEEIGFTVLRHEMGSVAKDSEFREMLRTLPRIVINTDGSSIGNPGKSGCAVVICDASSEPLVGFAWHIGDATNNVAEYKAIAAALGWMGDMGLLDADIEIRTDSELVVKQLSGEYKVKSPLLHGLFTDVSLLKSRFKRLRIRHVQRETNIVADKLAKDAANQWRRTR